MSKRKKTAIIISSVCVGLALIILLGLIFTGLYVGWGPFTYLQFDSQERAIVEKYDAEERQGEIVFYGASNFRLWTEMENDLSEYKVQNHGFGGSTDKDLVERAETLLYPYAPAVMFFQTGFADEQGKIEKENCNYHILRMRRACGIYSSMADDMRLSVDLGAFFRYGKFKV